MHVRAVPGRARGRPPGPLRRGVHATGHGPPRGGASAQHRDDGPLRVGSRGSSTPRTARPRWPRGSSTSSWRPERGGSASATASQVVLCRAFGISRVFLANELVDPAAIDWILRRAGGRSRASSSSPTSTRSTASGFSPTASRPPGLATGCAGSACSSRWGPTGGRTGCRTVEEAIEVGRAATTAGLPVAGVAGYEGGLGSVIDAAVLGRVRAFLGLMREAAEALLAKGLVADPGRPILSAGGKRLLRRGRRRIGRPAAQRDQTPDDHPARRLRQPRRRPLRGPVAVQPSRRHPRVHPPARRSRRGASSSRSLSRGSQSPTSDAATCRSTSGCRSRCCFGGRPPGCCRTRRE